jgi:glutamate synthase (NADPH/NADH) small chain
MGDVKGFLKHTRELPERRPVPVRLKDWKEVYEPFPIHKVREQAGRCMDCGIPFCNNGCPLGNLIPDWNDLVYKDRWREAIDRLHATNNFPEFTGRLCPAPCEAACVLGINQPAVTIKQVEVEIIDRAWSEGWVAPVLPSTKTGKKVAVIGSGPAGLATAQQLTRAGHDVVVFERDDKIGGLLRYGIPEFKMEKRFLDRRLGQMEAEGTEFRTNVNAGVDVTGDQLRAEFEAVVLAGGATVRRDLPIPGRELKGIHQAMEYLPIANRVQNGDLDRPTISAEGKHVIIIGGGDTGADCLGTAHRQRAASIHQFEIMPRPPEARPDANPWPTWPMIYRVSSAHEEGGERVYAVNTIEFTGDDDGNVTTLRAVEVEMFTEDGRPTFKPVDGSEFALDADLVLLAMGFTGAERAGLVEQLGCEIDGRGNVARDDGWQVFAAGSDGATNVDGVFVCGDMGRGQSLIVWAIAEGRSCAAAVDRYLVGATDLPTPLRPSDRPLN